MQQHPKVYDEAKLVSMAEPLNVRIERLKNNTRSPIPIPDHDDGSPGGSGWSQDEVRKIDTWLVSEWAGGGLYEVTITDSSVPAPITMRWQPFFDPREYPEKTPPTLAGASTGRPQAPLSPNRQVSVAAFPNGLPSNPFAQQQQPQQQQPYFAPSFQQATLPSPPPVGSNSWPQWQAEAERQRRDDELKTLREQAALREREATEARHRAELDRIRVENDSKAAAAQRTVDTQLAEMRNMIAGLTVTLKEGARPVGPDPAIVALQEQNRLLAAQAENERRERETERRERELKEMMRTTSEATQRQIDLLTKQFEERTRALTENRGPDPMLLMFKEIIGGTQRDQADALKEISRNHTAQVERMQSFMMSPQQMLAMAKESNAEAANATDRVTKFFGSVVEMQQKATEHILSIQPGGSGVIDVVREGIGGLKEFAERYVGAKERTEKLSMTAQAQIATAQASAIHSQAMAQAGLAGMPMNQNGMNGHNHAPVALPEPPPQTTAPLTVEALQPKGPARLWGRTDEEWFGPILDEVEQLRAGVDHFIESCRMDPIRVGPDGQPDGVRPEQAMLGVMTAVQEIAKREVSIAAIIDLFAKGQLAEFIGVLIPDAPQTYRDDLRELIDAELRKMAGDGEDLHATVDDDEDDEDAEDEPAKPAVRASTVTLIGKPPVKPTPAPARRA